MTALPIIETQSGDVSAYIPTNVISITDRKGRQPSTPTIWRIYIKERSNSWNKSIHCYVI
jgi:hypothetical protein